ncbi:ATP-binding protein [Streptomyces sp. BV286]|uniref:sensor histidine kinase n=1 Tax=Streptomyces sp. BV286 TaxID=2849672 RepID=UPI001C2E15D2|nr:ATP-binding protein [Streptomyces sp. BV286]MBV1941375.1 ATP-binding protein [Streptomyces sp. BV286]
MSHLRAPAARADRREGGRHGRPVARSTPALPETHIRSQLLRLAILPPIAVALSASAAVLFTVRTTAARPGPTLWIVLGGAVAVALAGIVIATVAADRASRSVHDRIGALRRASVRGQADLSTLVETLRRGDAPPARRPHGRPAQDADDFDLLAEDMASAHDSAVTAVVQASQLSSHAGSEQKVEVFVNLARRLQSLVHREISILDELENEIEDPDLLKGLFHVDHLATRIRRHAENLAVLGGAVSRRQWSNPVSMTEVLRSATAEVEQYSRVKLVPPIDGTVRGHAVADVIHLLAELVENATVFSAPHTQVLLRANVVTSGLAVEVEDRGLGMPLAEQHKMNALLADPDQVNVASLLQDGRIGLFVVSQLARRHGIAVRLQTNIYGGVQAVLVVPQALLGAPEEQQPGAGRQSGGVAPAGAASTAGALGPGAPASGALGAGPGVPGARSGVGHGAVTQGAGGQGGPGRGAAAHGAVAPGTPPHGIPAHGTTPAHGIAAHGTPAHGVPTHGTPAHGTPAHGTPEPEALAHGTVGRGTAAHGTPAHGTPTHMTAASHGMSAQGTYAHDLGSHGVAGLDTPANGTPLHGTPVHGTPAHGVPVHGTPAHGTPLHGTPAHGTPLHGAPVRGTTAQGTPAPGTPNRVPGVVPGDSRDASLDASRVPGRETASHPSHEARTAVPAQPRRDGTPVGMTVVNGGGGPAPLPVRGAESRPNPSEAVPGIRPDDRRAVAENTVAPPVPRNGVVRGTMGRPQLPKRRAQEHIVPELRGGPAPRQDSEFVVGHDPGLMAAFQRGIGLAEAQNRDEFQYGEEAPYRDDGSMGSAHMELAPMDSPRTEPARMDATPLGETHPEHEPPEAPAPRESAPAPGHDLTARHDGSTPAG